MEINTTWSLDAEQKLSVRAKEVREGRRQEIFLSLEWLQADIINRFSETLLFEEALCQTMLDPMLINV
jgi:hypothetical protein